MPKTLKTKNVAAADGVVPDVVEPNLLVPLPNGVILKFGPRERSEARRTFRAKFDKDYLLPKVNNRNYGADEITFAHLLGALQNPSVTAAGELAYWKLYEQVNWSDLLKLFSAKLPIPASYFGYAAQDLLSTYDGRRNVKAMLIASELASNEKITEEAALILLNVPDDAVKQKLILNEAVPDNIRTLAFLTT